MVGKTNVPLDLLRVDPILNNNSWETIRKVSDRSEGANYWAVGDRKEVTLNGTVGICTFNNYSCYAFIIGFDHNAELEGEHRIHFQFAKTALSGGTDICFVDSNYNSAGSSAAFRMNTSETNIGGWEDSYMRKVILGSDASPTSPRASTMLAALPSDLRACMKSITKYTDNTGGRNSSENLATVTTDYLPLLSEYEVYGEIINGNYCERNYQQQYQYFELGNSKIKYQHNSADDFANWWLRSPRRLLSNSFCYVNLNGLSNYMNALRSYGVAPGFCV